MQNYNSYLDNSLEKLKQYLFDMQSRPILFIGSGFSQRYINSPTWYDLLNTLIKENPDIDMPLEFFIQEYNNDYIKIASVLVEEYRKYAWRNQSEFPEYTFTSSSTSIHLKYKISSILNELMEQFDPDFHDFHEEISLFKKLNPQAIITTNYDTLLENLFPEPEYEPIVGQQVIYKKESTNLGHILKIHGSVKDCDSIVIEQKDYNNFEKNQIYLTAKLFTYFMEHPVIFIGYSLSDDNIKAILYNVKQILDSEREPMIDNMWFIDWSREPVDPRENPAQIKSISVGNGESVRINYIKLHTYEKLYETLYQDSVDMNFLKRLEETVYNVVKSDTITNLEVDIASLHYLTERESLLNTFTHVNSDDTRQVNTQLLTFSQISDPNQLASQFSLTATQLSEMVFDIEGCYWLHAYRLIEDIFNKTGINLRNSNNNYHVSMNNISRYSIAMVDLLKKSKNSEPFTIVIDDNELSYP